MVHGRNIIKNAGMSAYEANAYLSDMLAHHQFIESLEGMVASDGVTKPWEEWTTTNKAKGEANGWDPTKFPQLKNAYMANQLRWVFDDYAGRGFDDKSLGWAREMSERVTKLLFWNPVPHLMNVATHAFTARGWKWLPINGNYRTLAESATRRSTPFGRRTLMSNRIFAARGNLPSYGALSRTSA